MRRKLATILVADIAGYSRLMGEDEARTLGEFRRLLNNNIRPAIRRRKGRIIKMLGDGFLVEFDSPVNAINCAMAIQSASARRSKAVPGDQQLHFRIGINLGDIIFHDNDIAGDAVNIAARLQSLADPDGVLVTDTVFQHVKRKVDTEFEDIGLHSLKNIAEPVKVYRAATRTIAPSVKHPNREFEIPVVAVLPFANFSGETNQQYFSDGITEDIITELSRFRTISVVARNSSFIYRDKAVDVKQVARELGVDFVVEGSVRRFDSRARITVQLVNAASRLHVWAEKYDVDHSAIFQVQDDVTRRIVGTLVPRLESEELEMARRRPTGEIRAYDSYLRGKASFYAATDGAGVTAARRHFEEAVAIDPGFARAWCFLVRIDNTMVKYMGAGAPVDELRTRAWINAQKAASLDESDPRAHICLSWCHLWRHEFDAARKHLDIATRLNPNDADCAMDRGTTLLYLGDPEAAIETMQLGIRLNPFHPDSYLADLAEAYFVARRYSDMISIVETLPDPSPQFSAWKAAGYAYAGRASDARRLADQFISNIREIWAGAPDAGPADYVAWLLNFHPFRRPEDAAHFAHGLHLAGLPVHVLNAESS